MAVVSVVIPSYRRPHLLRMALSSVRAQTFKDIEVIVHDNASPDGVAAVIEEFPDLSIRFFCNEHTVGQTLNIVRAMRLARGKYLALLADDDCWKPDFLERMVKALEEKPECILAFSNYEIIDESGGALAITRKIQHYHGNHLLAAGYHASFEHIATIFRSMTVVSGCLLRRDATDWTNVPADLSYGIDIYIAFLAARAGGLSYFDAEPLIQIRYHTGTVTSATGTDVQEIARKHQGLLVLWDSLLNDPAMRHKRYYLMKRWWYAWALVLDRLRLREWRSAIRQLIGPQYYDPRAPIYFVAYLIQFKLMGLERRFLP